MLDLAEEQDLFAGDEVPGAQAIASGRHGLTPIGRDHDPSDPGKGKDDAADVPLEAAYLAQQRLLDASRQLTCAFTHFGVGAIQSSLTQQFKSVAPDRREALVRGLTYLEGVVSNLNNEIPDDLRVVGAGLGFPSFRWSLRLPGV